MAITAAGPVPARAEVVVVGGGVIGTSIAFHLAEAGVTDVLVLESGVLGSGSSGKPLGGVRAQFSGAANIRLGARSLDAFRGFGHRVGADIGLRQVGYLFVLRTAEEVSAVEEAVALQNSLGVPSRVVTPAEAAVLCPYLDTAGVLAAAFSPEDGFARPGDVVRGYATAAQRLGARVATGTPVTGVDVRGGEVTAVRTARGSVTTSVVVVAAGAWSRQVGAMASVDLPVEPLRRQIAFTPPLVPPPARSVPFTVDLGSTLYLHPDSDGGLLVGMSDPQQAPGFDRTYDPAWLPVLRAALARCAPSLSDVPLGRGWAGLYETTPDCDALIGAAPAVGRLLYATGFSGHGFLMAPAVGEVVRDLYLGVEPPCDVSGFDARRFAGTLTRTERHIV